MTEMMKRYEVVSSNPLVLVLAACRATVTHLVLVQESGGANPPGPVWF